MVMVLCFQDWLFAWIDTTSPVTAISIATGLAILAILMLYGILMGCQMAFLRTQRRAFATWDRVMSQTAPTPEKNDEASLKIEPAPSQPNISANNWAAMRGQTSTFQPEGRGSNFQREVGGRFASLPRIHRPAPPPPVAPYRSFRFKGRRQVQNSLPAIEAFNLDDMEDDIGETQL